MAKQNLRRPSVSVERNLAARHGLVCLCCGTWGCKVPVSTDEPRRSMCCLGRMRRPLDTSDHQGIPRRKKRRCRAATLLAAPPSFPVPSDSCLADGLEHSLMVGDIFFFRSLIVYGNTYKMLKGSKHRSVLYIINIIVLKVQCNPQ